MQRAGVAACYDARMQIPSSPALPAFVDVLAAAARIAPHAHVTPVLRSRSLDALAGCELFFKCENFQRAGAFKFRGACNAVYALDESDALRGVVTQSSGNHGAALALACKIRGLALTVVVPEGAPAVKLAAIADAGATIVRCAPTMAARNAVTEALIAETGAALIHPFDNAHVIAGQATSALELLRECSDLNAVLTPVGGGGLLSGSALTVRSLRPDMTIWGAEPTGAADAHASLQTGQCITDRIANTVCDGLRGHLAPRTLHLLQRHVDGILLVEDAQTIAAMRLLWERLKLVIEPSGTIGLAAVMANRERFAGQRVGIVLSGGNVDLDALPWQMHA